MTINARAEEDVEPECIMQKVARASGANYAFHKESGRFQDAGPQAPVVSAAGPRAMWQDLPSAPSFSCGWGTASLASSPEPD